MMNSLKTFSFAAAVCALALLRPSVTRADDTAVQVATVNGFPVFHSKVLVSRVKDDIDRALLLQAYEKDDKAGIPEDLVEKTIRKIVMESYGGDESRLIKELAAYKITPGDFKQFTSEELVLAAMLTNYDKQIKAGWLTELRKAADIQKAK